MHPVHLPTFASPGLCVRTSSSPIQEHRNGTLKCSATKEPPIRFPYASQHEDILFNPVDHVNPVQERVLFHHRETGNKKRLQGASLVGSGGEAQSSQAPHDQEVSALRPLPRKDETRQSASTRPKHGFRLKVNRETRFCPSGEPEPQYRHPPQHREITTN